MLSNPDSLRVLHLANWNSTNIGNGALIKGSEKVFAEDYPGEVTFVPEAWDDYTFKRKKFDESFVRMVNEKADVLMVNGAVTFNAFRLNMNNAGMRFDLPLHLWDQIKVPVVLYGLSYRCWPFQKYPNTQAFTEMLRYAIDNKRVFLGVRNDGTKEWIKERFAIDSPDIHEVPDPGLFVPAIDGKYPEINPERKNVIIALNGEDAVYRYVTKTQKMLWGIASLFASDFILEKIFKHTTGYRKRRREVSKKIAKVAEQLALKYDVQFILAPHYLDDYGMIEEFIEEVQERVAHQLVISTGLMAVPHTEYFYGRYAQADLVIAMRVHSMSPSIGLNTPVIPLTSQGRMRVFLKKLGLSDIAIDITDEDAIKQLLSKAESILDNPQPIKTKLHAATDRARNDMRAVNQKLIEFINN